MLTQYVSPAGRRARRDEEGLTLIEVIIAGFVLSIAVLGLASVASTSLMSVRDSRERDRATAAASSAIEAVRALDYDEIALAGTDWQADPLVEADGASWRLDHDGSGTATELIWAGGSGVITPYMCSSESVDDCWFTMPAGTRVEVRTFVTWYAQGLDPQFAKRVTAVATWNDPSLSVPRTVHMSTVIADADRGLPAPAFEVFPVTLTTQLDDAWVDAGLGHCFQHTVNNFGSPDSYEIVLAPTVLEDLAHGWAPTGDVGTQGTWQNEYWTFRAYFVPPDMEKGDVDTLMLPDPDAGTSNVVSSASLDTGESATIHFCYEPREGDGDGTSPSSDGAPSEYRYEPTVSSRFDPSVTSAVEHTIVVDALHRLYLHYGRFDFHDDDEDEEGSRNWWEHIFDGVYTRPVADRVDGIFAFDQLPMMPGLPPNVSMPHYDTQIHFGGENFPHADGPNGRLNFPGMFLPRGPVAVDEVVHPREAFAIEWDWQFDEETAPVTYAGSARIHLWARQSPDGIHPHDANWCLRADLQKFAIQPDGSLDPTPANVGTVTLRWTTRGGLRKLDPSDLPAGNPLFLVPWNADTSFAPGDVLRLRIVNAGTDHDATCVRINLGFGVLGVPGSIDLLPAS